MTVSTIAALATGIGRNLSNQNNRAAESVRSLVSTETPGFTQSDVAELSTAGILQNQASSLRLASRNIAAATALLTTADGAAAQIGRALDRMRDITSRVASPNLSGAQQAALSGEFQSLRQQIDRIAGSASFGGQTLFDGSLANGGENVGGTGLNLTLGGLRDADLFADAGFDLTSAAGAEAAAAAIGRAQEVVNARRNELGALADGFDYAAATIASALQNQDAARATFSADDLAALGGGAQALLQADAAASLLAQTNRLPGGILQLLSE